MNDYVTKREFETTLDVRLKKQTEEIVNDLTGVIQGFMVQVDARFNKIEADIAELNKKYDHLVQTLDTFIARIDHYETEMAMRDRQFERLLVWAKKVSKKTGIPLENL